jgi:uncharacterized protein
MEMNTRAQHLAYIKKMGVFTIECNKKIFSPEEIAILEKYGHWFDALTSGNLIPLTDMQNEFIKVANGEKTPITPAETAWHRYLGRKAVETKYGDRLNLQYKPESDSFYNREMAKQQRKMMFNEMSKNHRS